MKKKIILLGYMASGKTTIASMLAKELNFEWYDLDQIIEKNNEITIPEIFKNKGEIYFRKLEHQTLNEILLKNDNLVLSLGGGTPCYANNHFHFESDEVISIYLKASIETLYNRLLNEKEQRPLLQQYNNDTLQEFIAKHLFERSYFYNKAKKTINIDNKSTSMVVKEIIDFLT